MTSSASWPLRQCHHEFLADPGLQEIQILRWIQADPELPGLRLHPNFLVALRDQLHLPHQRHLGHR